MSGPFATAAELSEFTGLGVPDDLARIQALLDYSSSVIRRHTGQTLSEVVGDSIIVQPESTTAGIQSPLPRAWGNIIFLPERPVTAVAVTINAVSFTAFKFTTEGLLYRTDGQAWGTLPITVVYTHGYPETSDVFIAIKAICIEAALRAYAPNASGSPAVLNSIAIESAGYAPMVFLTEGEKQMLPNHARVAVG
jgi:hypothetical protein